MKNQKIGSEAVVRVPTSTVESTPKRETLPVPEKKQPLNQKTSFVAQTEANKVAGVAGEVQLPSDTAAQREVAGRAAGLLGEVASAASVFATQRERIKTAPGFFAALDQSGGSTAKALGEYGLEPTAWSNEKEMFDLVHQMRTRLITSDVFSSERILGAILFEGTMDREIQGIPSVQYLWEQKGVVPFLKIDKGLADVKDGVQLMKPIPDLDALLERAKGKGVFGTKERSLIKEANPTGIAAIVRQQVDLARQVIGKALVPIIEPEVDIKTVEKAKAEELLRAELLAQLDTLAPGEDVILKLTLPEKDDFYRPLIEHPRVLKVVVLSGGYSRDEANARLSKNPGLVASFSRALLAGLSAKQSEAEFRQVLDTSIQGIFAAATSGPAAS